MVVATHALRPGLNCVAEVRAAFGDGKTSIIVVLSPEVIGDGFAASIQIQVTGVDACNSKGVRWAGTGD